MRNYRELKVWQKAHELTLAVYKATTTFPREEMYGLTSQIRRASASISANIAEGCGRRGDAELARFCAIASGSAHEVDYHMLLARDLKFLKSEEHQRLARQADEIKRMLASLIVRLKAEPDSLKLRA